MFTLDLFGERIGFENVTNDAEQTLEGLSHIEQLHLSRFLLVRISIIFDALPAIVIVVWLRFSILQLCTI